MKKSLLNTAVTIAFASTVFSGSVLSTQAYAADLIIADNDSSNSSTTENYVYQGMGAGAATGTVIAGPLGFIVGGVIGAVIGSNQEKAADDQTSDSVLATAEANEAINTPDEIQLSEFTEQDDTRQNFGGNAIQVAQLGEIQNVVDDSIDHQDALIDILTEDLSMDIYFRSGSTDIESFYPSRLTAIANLMNTVEKLELHLDGYTDRRGDKNKNIALANDRIDKVREQLVSAGVDESRIISKAFGEMKMVSAAGDLDAYTFDRKVVIRFERINADSMHYMSTALSATGDNTTTKNIESDVDPVVADASARF